MILPIDGWMDVELAINYSSVFVLSCLPGSGPIWPGITNKDGRPEEMSFEIRVAHSSVSSPPSYLSTSSLIHSGGFFSCPGALLTYIIPRRRLVGFGNRKRDNINGLAVMRLWLWRMWKFYGENRWDDTKLSLFQSQSVAIMNQRNSISLLDEIHTCCPFEDEIKRSIKWIFGEGLDSRIVLSLCCHTRGDSKSFGIIDNQ